MAKAVKSNDKSLDVVQITLSHQEMIDLISARASQTAVSSARDKLNFFLGMVGLTITLFGGVALLFMETRIEKILAKRTPQLVQEEVQKQTLASTGFVLLAAEAVSWEADQQITKTDADAVISGLEEFMPIYQTLAGHSLNFANSRIETVMDSFWSAGDYSRVMRVYDVFGRDIIGARQIYQTLADSMASAAILGLNERSQYVDLSRVLLDWELDVDGAPFEYQRILRLILDHADTVDVIQIQNAILVENSRYSGFSTLLLKFLEQLREESSEGGRHFSQLS
ncbi:MAG: hypothetical protein ACPG5U_07190, partial [Planktomarina sp.]